jgi:hypothetical protein
MITHKSYDFKLESSTPMRIKNLEMAYLNKQRNNPKGTNFKLGRNSMNNNAGG